MRGDDRDDAASAEQQPTAGGLADGVRGFLPHLGSLPKDDRILAYPAAENREDFQSFKKLRKPGLRLMMDRSRGRAS